MPDFLKGNYNLNNDNTDTQNTKKIKSLTEEFEENASSTNACIFLNYTPPSLLCIFLSAVK